MKKKITELSLFLITVSLAFGSWFFLDHSFFSSLEKASGLAFLFLSLFFIVLTLDFLILNATFLLRALLAVSLSISLFFTPNFFHLGILILVFLFLFSGQLLSQMEEKKRVTLDFYKIILPAKFIIVFSLALVVASQYFFIAKDKPVEEVIPKINFGQSSYGARIVETGASMLGLDGVMENPNLSVDDFILETYVEDRQLSFFERQIVLEEGRKNLSQIAGKNLEGNEKISTILPVIVNEKINQLLISLAAKNNLPVIPAIMAAALFLVVISSGIIFGRLYLLFSSGIFWLMIKSNLLNIKKISVDKEVLA